MYDWICMIANSKIDSNVQAKFVLCYFCFTVTVKSWWGSVPPLYFLDFQFVCKRIWLELYFLSKCYHFFPSWTKEMLIWLRKVECAPTWTLSMWANPFSVATVKQNSLVYVAFNKWVTPSGLTYVLKQSMYFVVQGQ